MNRFMATTAIALFAASGAIAQDSSSSDSEQMQSQAADGVFETVSPDASLQLGSELIGSAVYSSMTGSMTGQSGDMSSEQSSDSGQSSDSASSDSGSSSEQPEQIGEINDLVITQDGSVEYAVVGVGGFLGIGERDVAVAMSALTFQPDPENEGEFMIMVDATQEAIENAPEFDPSVVEGEASGASAEQNMENAGDNMENAAENTGDAAQNAAESTGDAAQNAAESAGDAAEQAGDAAENATQ